jgi:outer membrane protein
MNRKRPWMQWAGAGVPLLLFAPLVLEAQQTPARSLTLQDAIRVAAEQSEQVTIARAGVQRAHGEQYRARSEYFPQLFGSLSYTRTLKTEFSSVTQESDSTQSAEPCPSFNPNRLLPLSERVDSLESALRCRDDENPFAGLFSNLPFGRANQWNLGLSVSQNVFTGGRVRAQNRVASAGRRTAEIELASANAQLVLDITEAYYGAALSDHLLVIAEATMAQAERTLSHVQLARQVGDQPEFELLRAQVTRDNQRPITIQRRSERDLAHMRLKQMLNLPLDQPLDLTTRLIDATSIPVVTVSATESDTSSAARAPVRQANEATVIQEALSAIARAQRLPNLSLSSQFGRVAYPGGGLPDWNEFRSNWTVTASVQVPIFTGGRIRGDELVAQANVLESRTRLQQVRELAALDTRNAIERLRAAEAAWQASAGTVEQANRAYTIAEIRYKEGISTQLELNDSRILLQQAQANRAVAARDLQVARMRMVLLPDLPLGVGGGMPMGGTFDAGAGGAPAQQPVAPRTAPQTQQGRPAVPMQTSRGVSN